MVSSGRHAKKEIADALRRAEEAGFLIKRNHRGHRWGELTCGVCYMSRSIWSTPRDPGTHAKQLHRFVSSHTHTSPSSQQGGGRP